MGKVRGERGEGRGLEECEGETHFDFLYHSYLGSPSCVASG